MTDEPKVDLELDLRGLLCPLPMVMISKGMQDIPIGGVVRAVATDPGALADIPAWARSSGNEIVETLRDSGEYVFLVRRLK